MSIDNVFNIATTSLTAQRLAIEVTSENITNVNTPGYSRQVTHMETGQMTNINNFVLGTGVKVSAIQRSYDGLLQKQIVSGGSSYEQNLTRQTALQQIEPLFNELTTDGLGKTIQDFLGSWNDLSVNPQGASERQTVLARAQIMTDAFHSINTSLNASVSNADASLPVIADDISAKAKELASVNMQILETEQVGVNANELRDKRDLLVQELAKKAGINYSENPNGSLRITLSGGEDLVNGGLYARISAVQNAATPSTNDLYISALGDPPSTVNPGLNVTSTIGGVPANSNTQGELGGLLQVRDTIVPGLIANVDEMAYNLAASVNSIHQAGFGLDSSTNTSFFNPATAVPLPAAAATFAGYSGTISTNPAIIADINKIAAADADPAVSGSGNNRNALAMADVKTSLLSFSNGSSATVSGYYGSLVSNVGIQVQSATNATSQGDNFLRQLDTLRQSNSGVSLDEELTNLIKYQKAFEGAAKLITSGTQMLDTILALVT